MQYALSAAAKVPTWQLIFREVPFGHSVPAEQGRATEKLGFCPLYTDIGHSYPVAHGVGRVDPGGQKSPATHVPEQAAESRPFEMPYTPPGHESHLSGTVVEVLYCPSSHCEQTHPESIPCLLVSFDPEGQQRAAVAKAGSNASASATAVPQKRTI